MLPKGRPSGATGYEPGATGIMGTMQSPPGPPVQTTRDPKLWKKVKTKQGYTKWVKRGPSPKKALPLDKSKKKGSPRSYENIKKSKPVGKGKKGKGPS
jgi:hypothetical protein